MVSHNETIAFSIQKHSYRGLKAVLLFIYVFSSFVYHHYLCINSQHYK